MTPRKINQSRKADALKAPELTLPARIAPNMPPQTQEERGFKMEGIIYYRDDVTMTVFVQDSTGYSADDPVVVEWEDHLKNLGYYLYRMPVEPPTDVPAKKQQPQT